MRWKGTGGGIRTKRGIGQGENEQEKEEKGKKRIKKKQANWVDTGIYVRNSRGWVIFLVSDLYLSLLRTFPRHTLYFYACIVVNGNPFLESTSKTNINHEQSP